MEKILNSFGGKWNLTLVENHVLEKDGFSPVKAEQLINSGYTAVPASVPGNFELDLFEAGLAPDPYFGQNPFGYQQYENRHLFYYTYFDSDFCGDENTFLVFDGIDTVADIFLNGEFIGHTENMFVSHEFNVKNLKEKDNELIVHIYPATIYARKYELKPMHNAMRYNYESLALRKAPSMYGWDIMPRFVSGGIWKKVRLVQRPKERIEQFYIYTTSTDIRNKSASVNVFFEAHSNEDYLRGLKLTVDGTCGDSDFHAEQVLWHNFGNIYIGVENAVFWYPKNAGEQPLYDVTVKLWRDGEVCDSKKIKFGIRTVELLRTSTTDEEGNGEFVFKVNGKKVFCMGSNWVPLDAFHSRDLNRLHPALDMLDDLGCNIVRCWGGNVYENDEFFDFCDEHGIMVWQDFAMGCATYPQDDWFAKKLYDEAVFVVKRLRNHASLILWAGDNEVDYAYGWNGVARDPNYNRLTRNLLAEVIREYDVVRPYLPSSPYIDNEAYRTSKPTSEEHLWGPRDYFKGDYYRNTVCHFASETGYHGCPSPKSLEKFISRDKLWPIFNENNYPNNDWICHSACMEPGPGVQSDYRVPLMTSQLVTLFGSIPDSLEEYAIQSQISQAEAKKYFIERFRISKWRRTGIIWWNLIDGWPQISDAIVDYYNCKKLAYSYIKRSQSRLCLMFDEPKDGKLTLYAVNDWQENKTVKYMIVNITSGEQMAKGIFESEKDSSASVVSLPVMSDYNFLYIEWQTEDGISGCNHFVTKTRDISYSQYMSDMKKAGFYLFEGF